MRLLDLFSGIGGFSLGLERAGFETVAFCEISAKPRHLLATHWPDVPCFDDVTTLTAADLPAGVDAICGGFPCQDISTAGKGAGMAGERSGLWREYARLVREFRPRYVIVENVSALLGRGLGDVLGDLASLGYDAWWDCIPASAVGAPHRRDRVWIVAYPGGVEHKGYGHALRREIAAGLSRAAAEQGVQPRHDAEADAFDPDADRFGSHRARVHVHGDAELRDEQVSLFEPLGGDVADAPCELRDRGWSGPEQNWRPEPANGGPDVANAGRVGRSRPGMSQDSSDQAPARGGQTVDAQHGRLGCVGPTKPGVGGMVDGLPAGMDGLHVGWAEEPPIPRVASGVPARSDRLHGLGNAVVPQIPEIIGRAIIAAEASLAANDARPAEEAA